MEHVKVLYRDDDRLPYLCAIQHCATRFGLDIELRQATGRAFGEVLEAGEVDVLAENYWGLQSFRAGGAPFVSLATSVSHLNEQLYVHPSVHRIEDLRGKRFAVRSIGPQQYITDLWLTDMGLADDVEQVIISEPDVGRWMHWKLVLEGEFHGCFVTNSYADAPREAGLPLIPTERYPFLGNVTLTATESFTKERAAVAQALVDAAFAATNLFRTDPETTTSIMRR